MTEHLTKKKISVEYNSVCLLLKQESCKPYKLHSGYRSASCHKEGRKNVLALKIQDFFWQHKLHD